MGITGNVGTVDPRALEGFFPGVLELIRVTKPYKLASREMHPADTTVKLPQTSVGPGTFTVIAGPCSVENEEMILRTAEFLCDHGVRLLRAGACTNRAPARMRFRDWAARASTSSSGCVSARASESSPN